MARMVDADALAKAMGVYTYMQTEWTPATAWGVPIVDAEPVVRCKDCKDGQRLIDVNGLHYLVCGNPFGHGIMVGNHNFCSWGERRKDETG